jgi:uncharacterized protein YcbX
LHDRIFLLRNAETLKVLQIAHVPGLALFVQLFDGRDLLVRHANTAEELRVPLEPGVHARPEEVIMYGSGCLGYDMGDGAAKFFSIALGFPVRMLYIGDSRRSVLGSVAPRETELQITFADCAPIMLTNAMSLADGMDMSKFRPNVVVARDDGTEDVSAFEEDFWAEVLVAGRHSVALTANCARCTSLNVDYETGGWVPADQQPLKRLMRNRRVDPGMRYSPIFGRYGYLPEVPGGGVEFAVGDRVTVVKRNAERTVFCRSAPPPRTCLRFC